MVVLRMSIGFKQLEIFSSVVIAGSITKAASKIGLSQPTISQQLAKLEDQLGTQLILRNRTGQIDLTAAGEYWFKSSTDLLRRHEAALADHASRFAKGNVVIKMGVTPTLRRRIAGAAARIALQEDKFARFELIWSINSADVVERLRLHQINFAIVGSTSIEEERSSYIVTPVFRDTMAWVVPSDVPIGVLKDALNNPEFSTEKYPSLSRYVTVGPGAPLQLASDDWYRSRLPFAAPVFGGMTYPAAVDFVAEGLATAHCPLSHIPNLSPSIASKLQWFTIDELTRDIVLVMPKHLLTLPAYSRIHHGLQEFIRTEYSSEMAPSVVLSLSTLL